MEKIASFLIGLLVGISPSIFSFGLFSAPQIYVPLKPINQTFLPIQNKTTVNCRRVKITRKFRLPKTFQ